VESEEVFDVSDTCTILFGRVDELDFSLPSESLELSVSSAIASSSDFRRTFRRLAGGCSMSLSSQLLSDGLIANTSLSDAFEVCAISWHVIVLFEGKVTDSGEEHGSNESVFSLGDGVGDFGGECEKAVGDFRVIIGDAVVVVEISDTSLSVAKSLVSDGLSYGFFGTF